MRVSTGQLSQLVLQGLQQQDLEYAKVVIQMSSGYRINRISDDPLGSVTVLGIEREPEFPDSVPGQCQPGSEPDGTERKLP